MLRVGLVVVIVLSSVVSVVLGGALAGLKGGNMMQPFCRSGSYRPDAGDLLPASGNAPYSLKIVTKVNQYRAGQAIEGILFMTSYLTACWHIPIMSCPFRYFPLYCWFICCCCDKAILKLDFFF